MFNTNVSASKPAEVLKSDSVDDNGDDDVGYTDSVGKFNLNIPTNCILENASFVIMKEYLRISIVSRKHCS